MDNRKTSLVVEPDKIFRDVIREICEGLGYQVSEAANGREAKNLISDNNYDLVIADVRLEVIDGLQLLSYVKETTKSLFMLLADRSEVLQAQHAYQLGADEFLNKPFSRSEFLKVVASAFDKECGKKLE